MLTVLCGVGLGSTEPGASATDYGPPDPSALQRRLVCVIIRVFRHLRIVRSDRPRPILPRFTDMEIQKETK
jgi:hypothetical protein